VSKLDGLFGSHLGNLERSLDRTTLRQGLIANNIANVNTPGYKRKDVDFGIELNKAMGDSGAQLMANDAEIKTTYGSNRRDGNSVDLEGEVVHMAETENRYRLLSEMTTRYFNGLKNVIREGR
jgi:flagellar basal-body rod protein FlgB